MPKIIEHIDLIQDRPWAVHPAKLEEIQILFDKWIAGDKIEFPEIANGKGGNKSENDFEIKNGVAIIPIYGIISKKANLFTIFSGGTSIELLQNDIETALSSNKVKSILLDVDSPGGTTDGTKDLADFIFKSRGKKPIIAYANGLMASAAMWIGSAAEKIFTNETSIVGSIGVFLTHYDYSESDKKSGIKRTTISAGQYKAITSEEKPLSTEGKEYLQSHVDYFYSLFVDGIARNRGVDVNTVIDKMADGKLFIGKQAQKAGLVDNIKTFKSAFSFTKTRGVTNMNFQEFKAEHPELFQEVFQAGFDSAPKVIELSEEKIDPGALKAEQTKERERVVTILSEENAPLEARLQAVKEGKTVDQAYKMFFQSAEAERNASLEKYKESGEPPVKPEGTEKTEKGKIVDFDAEAMEYQKTHPDVDYAVAASIAISKNPKAYEAQRNKN